MRCKFYQLNKLALFHIVIFLLLILGANRSMAAQLNVDGTAADEITPDQSSLQKVAAGEDSHADNQAYSEKVSVGLHLQPVTVITRRDIELSGITTIDQLLLGRAAFNNFGLYRPFILGGNYISVTINGRRISDSDFDYNTIPMSAVERIEIFKDSTPVRNGKAIGGTVNIVLRKDYEGFEVQTNVARPSAEGADSEYLNAIWGGKIGRGHLTIGVDIFRRNEVRDADRDYSRASYAPGGSFSDVEGVSVRGNTVFIETTDGNRIAAPINDCDENIYTGVLTNPPGGIQGTVCGFAYADISWHLRRRENEAVFMNFNHPLGNTADIYIEGRIAKESTRLLFAPEPADFSFMPTEELKQDLIGSISGLDSSNFPEKITVAHRFLGHGNRQWDSDLEEYDLLLGVKGKIKDNIDYDAYVRYYRYDAIQVGSTFIRQPTIQTAIENGKYDIQNPLSEAEGHQAVINESSLREDLKLETEYVETSASLSGQSFEFINNRITWKTGLQFGYTDYSNTRSYFDRQNQAVDTEEVLGGVSDPVIGDRRRFSVFGDLLVPVGDSLDTSFALRRDEFSDVGGIFAHRIATLYRLIPGLAFRSSWSGGARPPSLSELLGKQSISHPYICDAETVTPDCSRDQVEYVTGGNPNLQPDDAENLAAGVLTELGPFSASADFFRLRVSEIPNKLSPQVIIDLEKSGGLAEYPDVKVTRLDGRLERIESPLSNSGEIDMDGFTVQVEGAWEISWVDIMLNANWLKITNYETRIAGDEQVGGVPDDRLHVLLRTDYNDITAQWNMHVVSGYSSSDGITEYGSWIGHDLALNWGRSLGFGKLQLTGGILNIGDKSQPSTESSGLYLDSILGRTFFLTAKLEI